MKSVVIIEELKCGEIYCYRSIEEAARHLEAIDVENGEYEAFDYEGFPLTLSVDGRRVKIERASGAASKKEDVEAKLRRFVGEAGGAMTFEEVIAAAQKRSRGWLAGLSDYLGRKKDA